MRLPFVLILAVLSACGLAPSEEERGASIVNPMDEGDLPDAICDVIDTVVRVGGVGSGVIIHRGAVLTVEHATWGDRDYVDWGPGTPRLWGRVVRNPREDMALILLEQPLSSTHPVADYARYANYLQDAKEIYLAGYGRASTDDGESFGTLRVGKNQVANYSGSRFKHRHPAGGQWSTICAGDSGGPTFNERGMVLGIHESRPRVGGCGITSYDISTNSHASWIGANLP